ncbi:glycosyltransferase family 2 protein [Microbacterium aoyamense]|uniref:Glycosyltransferase family 2 protein n=1 Tax=Microbacterium aoyamense TaxID=344166 RepID=A0ABN2PV94_9MICO|nr:glycosyltransferase family 2 protein [Microbacterium aoyamense]
MSVVEELYLGVPLWAQILFWIALAISVCSLISVTVLLVNSLREKRQNQRDQRGTPAESEFLWVFMVPALNEEVTIADSVQRLRQTEASNAVFLVIDDGSDDGTAAVLAGIHDPRLHVLTRHAPHARQGKAAALNNAYRHLRESILTQPEYARWSEDRVIVTIVDADGRLDPKAPESAGRRFLDPGVGGVQTLVRIYNRRGWLTWAQDVEFSSFGLVFQAGRAWWGTANMGGNGQFNRLAALADVADDEGPWRHKLTEDQDLGVRLIQAGWAGVQVNDVTIDQQGLNSLRRLYKQRVRWAQGAWQALALLRGTMRGRMPLAGRVDAVFYLLTPILQLVVGFAFVTSIALWVFLGAEYRPSYWWVLIFFFAVAFGPGIITLILRGGRWYSPFTAIVLLLPYTVYSWMIFPVVFVSLLRQLSGRTSWAKTERERLDAADEPSTLVRADS